MNWKFWQQPAAPARRVLPRSDRTEADQRRHDLQRLLTLAGVGPDNALWQTVLSYADEHAANEQQTALQPDLPDAVRQFNCGRAASALDFATALRELHAKAQREAAKAKAD